MEDLPQDRQSEPGIDDLRQRTKQFALRVVRLYGSLPSTVEAQVIGKQCLRSATSVGANFREAKRARSTAEYVSKLGIVEQELDETLYWLELLAEAEIVTASKLSSLMDEADQLLRIVVTLIRKAKP